MTPDKARPTGRSRLLLSIPCLLGTWLLWTSLAEPFPQYGVMDGKRLLEVLLFPVLVLAALLHPGLRSGFAQALTAISRPVLWALAAFLLLGLASALRVEHPGYSLLELGLYVLLFSGGLVVAASRRLVGPAFDRPVLVIVALTGAGVFMLEMMGTLVYLGTDTQYSLAESLIRFGHPRMYNQVQTWTLPLLALLPLTFPRKRWLPTVTVLLIALQWYILATTFGRGSSLSLLTAMAVIAVLAPRHRIAWLRYQFAGLILGLLLFAGMALALNAIQPGAEGFVEHSVGRPLTSTSGRYYLWLLALQDIAANPWLGTGLAQFACDGPPGIANSPHNFPLQIFAAMGAPAFVLLVVTGLYLLFRLLRTVREADRGADPATDLACLATAALAAAFHAQFSGLFIAPASQVTGMLVVGWLWGRLLDAPATDQTARVPGRRNALAGPGWLLAALLISLAVVRFAVTELRVLPERTAYARDYGAAGPSFWRDGRVCLYSYEIQRKN